MTVIDVKRVEGGSMHNSFSMRKVEKYKGCKPSFFQFT